MTKAVQAELEDLAALAGPGYDPAVTDYTRLTPRRDRRDQRRPLSVAAGPAPLRDHVLRRQRVDGSSRRATGSSTSTTRRSEHEELYLVHQGRATFELDGERVDAPAGTLVFARPGVKRTAFAEEPETTLLALGGTPGKAYEPARLGALGAAAAALPGRRVRRGWPTAARAAGGAPRVRRACSTTSPAARALAGRQGRRDRAPPPRDRALGARSASLRKGRLGLRLDPRRARLQGAGRRLVERRGNRRVPPCSIGVPRFELGTSPTRTERATRLRHTPSRPQVSG